MFEFRRDFNHTRQVAPRVGVAFMLDRFLHSTVCVIKQYNLALAES